MNPDIAERRPDVDEFELDTSGVVVDRSTDMPNRPVWRWTDFSPFEQGFTKAAFASPELRNLNCDDDGGRGLHPRAPAFRDLSPEALALIRRDCAAAWCASHWGPDMAQAGRTFWDERQRGMWKDLRPLTLSISDDGKVNLR